MPKKIFSIVAVIIVFFFLFGNGLLQSKKAEAICNEGGCCEVVSKGLPGGRGREKVVDNKCSANYQPKPTYGTTDYCECIPSTVQICQIQGKSCSKDEQCNTDPGCQSFICYGYIQGRIPGICAEKNYLCPKAHISCSDDSECRLGGEGCANFTCWTVSRNNKECRLGSEPKTDTGLKISAAGQACEPGSGGAGTGGIATAIGCIPTEPKAFVEAILKFAAGAGGGIALLLMVAGAFRMITSAGNPETIKKGREQFSSAIIGLLFILFSVLLLKFIGVDILGLGAYLGY